MAEVACKAGSGSGGDAGEKDDGDAQSATTMPTEKTLSPAAQDEESDEDSLHLHVSDTEEADVTDKNSDEIPMEIEDSILNKFEIQEKLLKSGGVKGGKTEEEKPSGESTEKEKTVTENNESETTQTDSKEDAERESSNTEEKTAEPEKERPAKRSKARESVAEEEKPKTDEEGKSYEDHDLLAVMEEQTPEADDTEFEEGAEPKPDNENGEVSENNTDENQSDSEGQLQDKTENEDNAEAQVDIEEEEEDADDPPIKEEEMEETVVDYKMDVEEKNDENKENVENCNGVSVLETLLTDSKQTGEVKTTKRILSDDSGTEDDSVKKIKLEEKKSAEEKPQDAALTKLNSFKKYMLDKSLKGITREQLEIFCIQKMCECIVQKSEIGELKVKVKQQEQMLDLLRKEVLNVGKQTRDLNIVHQKVIQDVNRMQENSEKPLIVPKITRSVGLQAVIRVEETKRKVQRATVIPTKLVPIRTKPVNTTPVRNAPNVNVPPQKKNASPGTPVRTSTATTPNSTPKAGSKTPEVNGKTAGVIDLTDEDDSKKSTTALVAPNGTKVNMINAPNGHKFVVMPNGQTVMVKLATNQPMSQARTGTPNGIRGGNSAIRGMTPIRGLRPVAPAMPRNKTPGGVRPPRPIQNAQFRNGPQKNHQHPAPLPNAISVHVDGAKAIPPKPHLMLNKTNCGTGIVLSWKMPYKLDLYEKIASYQLYAYQETKYEPKTENWGKIGDVKALELPMAVTLTHFAVGNRYYFAVRAVDNFSRPGEFSHYETILL